VALVFATDSAASAFITGLVLIAVGLFMRWRTKPAYKLVATSGATETVVAESTDQARIDAASASLDHLRAAKTD
jgi:hypothetical protein